MAEASHTKVVKTPHFSLSLLALLAIPGPRALRSTARKKKKPTKQQQKKNQHTGQKARKIGGSKLWLHRSDLAVQTGCSRDILPDLSWSLRPRGQQQSDPALGREAVKPKRAREGIQLLLYARIAPGASTTLLCEMAPTLAQVLLPSPGCCRASFPTEAPGKRSCRMGLDGLNAQQMFPLNQPERREERGQLIPPRE